MNRLSLGLLGVLLAFNVTATDDWSIDTAHAAAKFKISHLMISSVDGSIGGIKGTMTVDDKDVTKNKVETTLDAHTINTGNAERDKHLKSADFFDAEKFPTMTFKSKKSVKGGKGIFQFVGDLKMHGVTKEVVLDVMKLTDTIKDPWGNTRRGFMAVTQLNRKDFGISWNTPLDKGGVALGDTVEITIDLELLAPKKDEKKT